MLVLVKILNFICSFFFSILNFKIKIGITITVVELLTSMIFSFNHVTVNLIILFGALKLQSKVKSWGILLLFILHAFLIYLIYFYYIFLILLNQYNLINSYSLLLVIATIFSSVIVFQRLLSPSRIIVVITKLSIPTMIQHNFIIANNCIIKIATQYRLLLINSSFLLKY